MNSWQYPHSYAQHTNINWAFRDGARNQDASCVVACFRLAAADEFATQCLIGKSCGNRGQSDSELDRGREAVTFYAANAQRDDMGAQP